MIKAKSFRQVKKYLSQFPKNSQFKIKHKTPSHVDFTTRGEFVRDIEEYYLDGDLIMIIRYGNIHNADVLIKEEN